MGLLRHLGVGGDQVHGSAAADAHRPQRHFFLSRNARMAAAVAAGCSSISQCPELAMICEVTSVATKRKSSAMADPNDLSAPIASTGIVNLPLAMKALLSIASCVKAAN